MRRAMVDSQLRTSGVTEAWVLGAMAALPREQFVPDALRRNAYMDRSIMLDGGHVLNPPVATALMLQAAQITADDRILLVGAPQGYVAALLAGQNGQVTAAETLAALPGEGSFSLIVIDGAVEYLPESLLALASEGARIVTGLAEGGVTRLATGLVRNGQVALRSFADSEIARLPEFARKPEFVF